jgi:hypothetical protein
MHHFPQPLSSEVNATIAAVLPADSLAAIAGHEHAKRALVVTWNKLQNIK